MSYDLYFYKKKNNSVSKQDIESYLKKHSKIISDNPNQWFYQNDATGVYFSFDFNNSEGEEEEEFFEDVSDEFEDTGFSFNINFIRPQFFGKEAFPFVYDFTDFFDLYVLNPQGEAVPMKYKKGELQKDWENTNLKFSKSYFEETQLNFLDEEISNYSWQYCLIKDDLQEELGEEYFVPTIFYLKPHNSRDIKTLCVWTEGIPFVLPKTDYVAILKNYTKFLFIEKKEEGVVSYKTIIKNFGQSFEDKDLYKILHPDSANEILKDFNSLKLETTIEKLGEGVSVEKFVNTK